MGNWASRCSHVNEFYVVFVLNAPASPQARTNVPTLRTCALLAAVEERSKTTRAAGRVRYPRSATTSDIHSQSVMSTPTVIDRTALRVFVAVLPGWLTGRHQDGMAYLMGENRIPRRQLRGWRLRLTDDERRAGVLEEIRRLVVQMAEENPTCLRDRPGLPPRAHRWIDAGSGRAVIVKSAAHSPAPMTGPWSTIAC